MERAADSWVPSHHVENTEPIVRSRFDLYIKDDMLIYVRERCS